MKLYISADIEGITGVTSWSETRLDHRDASFAIRQMEREVLAVCEAAYEKGFTEIVVKDAHETGRNMDIDRFPEYVSFYRGWSGHPYNMVEGIDKSFDALIFVGYHSAASQGTSPLSHTLHVSKIHRMTINGYLASEFLIHYYAGLYLDIPTLLLTGDEGICQEVKTINPLIETVSTKQGIGKATFNQHPSKVNNQIRDKLLTMDIDKQRVTSLPLSFQVEIEYKNPAIAYWASFYPGVVQKNSTTITFEADDYMDVLRLLSFVVSNE